MRPSWIRTVSTLVGLLVGSIGSAAILPRVLPFQGYLTRADGTAIPDGTRLVRFAVYDAPVAGKTVWAGEVHQLSVQGGLVNTILGSKSSLEGIRMDQLLYLEITVDAQTEGTPGHGEIGAEDPPLLPRQVLVPVLHAMRASELGFLDAEGRAMGAGWGAVFEGGVPGENRLHGRLLQDGSVGLSKLAEPIPATMLAENAARDNLEPSSIGSSLLAAGAIESHHISNQVVSEHHLADGAVSSRHIDPETIEQSHLKPRRTRSDAGVGEVAWSEPIAYFDSGASPNNQHIEVPGLSVQLETTGRPVRLGLSVSGRGGTFGVTGGGYVEGYILIFEDNQLIARFASASQNGGQSLAASLVNTLHLPETPGKKRYHVKVSLASGGTLELGAGISLYAYEL